MSTRRLSPLLLVLLLAGCRREDDPARLLADVRQRLAARDARLHSYVLAGTAREAGQRMDYEFAYRAPLKMLGTLGPPASRAWAWDGEHLTERDDTARQFSTYQDTLSPERRSELLTQLFSPFVPEGFRAPLLPGQGVTARRAAHTLAPEAVELTVRPPGGDVEVTYVLRWPALDFLGKRLRGGGTTSELRVEEEQCDPGLALCVPRRLTQWSTTGSGAEAAAEAHQVAETRLTRVELNPSLPAETFQLTAPRGYAVVPKTFAAPRTP